MKLRYILFLLLVLVVGIACAQQNQTAYITGTVLIDEDGQPAIGAYVQYQNHPKSKVLVKNNGHYRIKKMAGTLIFHCFGYKEEKVVVRKQTRVNVRLKSSSYDIGEVEIKAKRKKYHRRGNPAVELIRKAMASKNTHSIYANPYVSFDKYLRLTVALNEVTDTTLQYKRKQHMTDIVRTYAHRSPETGKMILPLSFQETFSREIYKKDPERRKSIVKGTHTETVLDVLSFTDAVELMFKDCFTDIDIFQDRTKVLRHNFLSPLEGQAAINFFHYNIADTLLLRGDSCYKVNFSPSNVYNMGFSGSLYILKDSSYRVRECHLTVPYQSNINWVESMDIVQYYDTLSTGEQVCTRNRMILQLKAVDWIKKFHVEHDAVQSNFSMDSISDRSFAFVGEQTAEKGSDARDTTFWQTVRPDSIDYGSTHLQEMKQNLMSRKWMRNVVFLGRMLIDNHIPTTFNPMKQSKVDIGPFFSMVGKDWLEGWRLRLGLNTTPALHKHLYLAGYVKYGFGDERWKGGGTFMWCFKERKNTYQDFPMRNLAFSYSRDTHSPFSRFLEVDKDNAFQSMSWSTNRMMSYYEQFKLSGVFELSNGLGFSGILTRENNRATGDMVLPDDPSGDIQYRNCIYRRLDGTIQENYTTTDIMLSVTYRPGAKFVSTKSKRHETNHNAPIYGISHTCGIRGFMGGQYNYNYTEITFQKRVWLDSWGNFDALVTGGIQWNQVPYTLLIVPHSNLSFFKNRNTFSMVRSMEFLNDRVITGFFRWDLNGKFFNLFPINRKLKWRAILGCNILWGYLSDKNNPNKYIGEDGQLLPGRNPGCLMYMPQFYKGDGTYWYSPQKMSMSKPYVEVSAGIHNILRLFSVDLFRRLTYTGGGVSKWGVRFGFEATF